MPFSHVLGWGTYNMTPLIANNPKSLSPSSEYGVSSLGTGGAGAPALASAMPEAASHHWPSGKVLGSNSWLHLGIKEPQETLPPAP